MPELRSSEGLSLIATQALVPLNESALPLWPAAHAAFAIVPLFPLPDASATVDPVPSSNEYAATSPVVAAEPVFMMASLETAKRRPPATSASSVIREGRCKAMVALLVEVESAWRLGHSRRFARRSARPPDYEFRNLCRRELSMATRAELTKWA